MLASSSQVPHLQSGMLGRRVRRACVPVASVKLRQSFPVEDQLETNVHQRELSARHPRTCIV